MAAVYTVNELRGTRRMVFNGRDDRLRITWETEYSVDVTGVDASTVSPLDVMSATGLPLVNRSVYYFNGKIIPYVVCRNKQATQDAKKLSRWVVTVRYETNEPTDRHESQEAEQDPPASLDDITPRVEVFFQEDERVLYHDKQNPPKPIILPTKNFFAQPSVERLAILGLRITQYEGFISFDDMLERKFKASSTAYRTKPRYTWFMENVEAIDAKIQLAGGEADVAQVTYTLLYNPAEDENGTAIGWKTQKPLIDTHHIEGGKKKPILDAQVLTETIGFIDSSGVWQKAATEPEYLTFEDYNTLDFNSFLKA